MERGPSKGAASTRAAAAWPTPNNEMCHSVGMRRYPKYQNRAQRRRARRWARRKGHHTRAPDRKHPWCALATLVRTVRTCVAVDVAEGTLPVHYTYTYGRHSTPTAGDQRAHDRVL